MLIILCLYLLLVWLVFSHLKLVKWSWASGTIVALLGVFILTAFHALFNYLTPSGSFTIVSRVVEIAPNVSGQVVSVPARSNVPVSAGTVLFQIDPTPFQTKVQQLGASLAQAKQHVKQLKSNYEQATANVEGLSSQLAFYTKRLADIQKLTVEQPLSVFRAQDTQNQYETVSFQLQAAKAAQVAAKLAMESEIDGVNTTVAQIRAQLEYANWELDQTTVRAPSTGIVTAVALAVGDRAIQGRSAVSFIGTDEITIVGMFSPNGFETIKADAPVKLVFDNIPGRIYDARIVDVPRGVQQGQVAAFGTLARSGAVAGARTFPAEISIPDDIDPSQLRLGMPGTAAVFSGNAGVIGTLKTILVWISSYTAYL